MANPSRTAVTISLIVKTKQRTLRILPWGTPSIWSKDGERVSPTRTQKVRLVNKCRMKIGKCPQKPRERSLHNSPGFHVVSYTLCKSKKMQEQTCRSQMQQRYHAPSEEKDQPWNGIDRTHTYIFVFYYSLISICDPMIDT